MTQQPPVSHIVCVGAGYVGGPTMAVIAKKWPEVKVTVVDVDARKIKQWQEGPLPIVEPGIDELVSESRDKNMFFSTDLEAAISTADMIFIAVGTPTKSVGFGAGRAALVEYVEAAARTISKYAQGHTIIVEKSTVPVGVSRSIRTVISTNGREGATFQILSNPEFLAEGTAIHDLMEPDRILIGHELCPEGEAAAEVLKSLYARWVPLEKILTVNVWSSELSKLSANAFLAQRISSINAISAICEKTGADVNEIAHAIGMDSRIGPKFLQASVGFGGSCFQKDILNLVYIAESLGLQEVADYWQQVIKMNDYQRERFVKDIVKSLFDTLQHKRIAVFGFAFKAHTGDTRESSSISVVNMLINENAYVTIYDPKVSEEQMFHDLHEINPSNSMDRLHQQVTVYKDPYECAEGAHALLIMTDWPEFRDYDHKRIYDSMSKPAFLFDGRNYLDREKLRKIGFCTHGIGVTPDQLG